MFTCCVWDWVVALYVLWYTRTALEWLEIRSIDFVNIITSRHFQWLFLIEIGATRTHKAHRKCDILTPFIAIMIPRSRNVSNFNSLQRQAKNIHRAWIILKFFFSPIFFRTVVTLVVVVVYHYKFQPITDSIMPDIIWLCTYFVRSKQNLMSHVSWSNFRVCFFPCFTPTPENKCRYLWILFSKKKRIYNLK